MSASNDKSNENFDDTDIDSALDRSARELQILANFYHQHGYRQRAQELYKTVLRIRQDRNLGDGENGR